MVSLKLAEPGDFDFFFSLKSEPSNIAWSGHDKAPDRENLNRFFMDCIRHQAERDARKIYLVLDGNTPVGHLYLIPVPYPGGRPDSFGLSPAISERYWRRGYAKEAIRLGLELGKQMGFSEMYTMIREDNHASFHAFSACGVQRTEDYETVYIPSLGKEVKMFIVRKRL